MVHMDHRAAAFSISTIFPSHFHGQGAESLSLHIPKKSVCMISDYIQRDYVRLTSRAESSEQAFFSIQRFVFGDPSCPTTEAMGGD